MKVTAEERTLLPDAHARDPRLTADDLARLRQERTGLSLSRRTVYRPWEGS